MRDIILFVVVIGGQFAAFVWFCVAIWRLSRKSVWELRAQNLRLGASIHSDPVKQAEYIRRAEAYERKADWRLRSSRLCGRI